MKTRNILQNLGIMILLPNLLLAEQRAYEDLKNIALNLSKDNRTGITYSVKDRKPSTRSLGDTQAYEIIHLNPEGWVIVSKDDHMHPVIGFSLKGHYAGKGQQALPFQSWMKDVGNSINIAKAEDSQSTKVHSAWRVLSTNPSENTQTRSLPTVDSQDVTRGPLIGNAQQWGQEDFYDIKYNLYVPKGTPVGCVATATAQVFAFHQWPKRGQGSHAYTSERYGEVYDHDVDFNTDYNWYTMTDHDYSKISYHIGVSLDMLFSTQGSGTFMQKAPLEKFFKYRANERLAKRDLSDDAWHARIVSNIDRDLPLIYAAGPHAFVLEGYKIRDGVRYYYFNWGYDGANDGWFTMENMHFTSNPTLQDGIRPDNKGEPLHANTTIRAKFSKNKPSVTRVGKYAHYYSFNLTKAQEVSINLSSEKDTYLVLHAGNNKEGTVIFQDDDGGEGRNSKITQALQAGNYTIEATTYDSSVSANFSIGLDIADGSNTYQISLDDDVSQKLSSQVKSKHRKGSYANYYTFTLTKRTAVVIDLHSKEDTYLHLLSGNNSNNASIGHDDDGGKGRNSRISQTLDAGVYTIEATSYSPAKSERQTIRVTTPHNIERITFNRTVNNRFDAQRRSAHRSANAKYYTFTLLENKAVSIDLKSTSDSYLYLIQGKATDGITITSDDDGGEGRNSHIYRTLQAGVYTIEATSYYDNKIDDFALSLAID